MIASLLTITKINVFLNQQNKSENIHEWTKLLKKKEEARDEDRKY